MESVFESKETAITQVERFLYEIEKHHQSNEALVYLNNIYNNYITYPRWKDLSKLIKLFFIFQYGEENQFNAFTCRFSIEFGQKLRNERYPEDYIRRRLNANFKNTFGDIVLCSFVLEDLRTDGHLHGIISNNYDKDVLKNILKRTFFGKNYRNSSVNNFSIKFKTLNCAYGWLAYILKRNSFRKKLFPIYISRNLTKLTKERYGQLKG